MSKHTAPEIISTNIQRKKWLCTAALGKQ